VRRLTAAFVLLALVAFGAGCRRKKKANTRDEGLASVINVADPADSPQLVRGFSAVEADAWRWSTSKFSVVLRPPTGAALTGANLRMTFTLNDTLVNKLGPVTVSARVNGTPIDSETFSKAGDSIYTHEVPASALGSDAVTVEFSTDKFLAPTDQDKRELALIVKTIGLVDKPKITP
jgi:hypothetical protein